LRTILLTTKRTKRTTGDCSHEVLFFVFFVRFVVNKINCRQNETRLTLTARILTFYSNNKEEQKTGFFDSPPWVLVLE